MYNYSENRRYTLDDAFANINWGNIFTSIDNREHIFTIWFDKTNFQQNEFQSMFEIWPPHKYMLKPTRIAIDYWETVWRNQQITLNTNNPMNSEWVFKGYRGFPSDYFRGIAGGSYMYIKNGIPISQQEYFDMLTLRLQEDYRSSLNIMEGYDTVVFKYSIGKGLFDQDANFMVYRAAGIHLYSAELYCWWKDMRGGEVKLEIIRVANILNDGSNYGPATPQMGVRGRIGLGNGYDGVPIVSIILEHDPYTNKIIGYKDLTGDIEAKQRLYEEYVLAERARELAFEGERFYDLMRAAERRDDPSFLAEKVAAKYPSSQRDHIYNLLLNKNNWYIHVFD
jgi:hypothetical protein